MLKGSDSIECADSGQWTAPAAVCEGTVPPNHSSAISRRLRHYGHESTIRLSVRHSFTVNPGYAGLSVFGAKDQTAGKASFKDSVQDSIVKVRDALAHVSGAG